MTNIARLPDVVAPILGQKFNGKVDAESIMASMCRQNGQTLDQYAAVTWFPHDSAIVRKAHGQVQLPSGVVVKAEHFFRITAWQDDYARRLVKFLNYEMSYDGVWAVAWCNSTVDGYATELRFGFQDRDGDLQFLIGSDLTLVDLQTRDDVRRHGKVCDNAYNQWRAWQRDVDVQPEQTIKAAQGQQQADPKDQPFL